MQKRAHHAPFRQGEETKEHIAHLADGGIGQALFEHALLKGQHGAQEHGDDGQYQPGLLDPGAPQEIGTGQIIDRADDAQHARLGDDAGQHGAGRGRSHRVGRGQPAVQREHARLDGEAQYHQEQHGEQQALVARHLFGVQHAARGEGQRIRIAIQEEDARQGQGRADDGIDQIFDARRHGLLGLGVGDQGQGQKGHGLVEHVQGHDGAAQAQAHQRRQGEQVEGVKALLVLLVVHVLKAVNAHAQEHQADKAGIEPADVVDFEQHRDGGREIEQGQATVPPQDHGQHRRHRGGQGDGDGHAAQAQIVQGFDEGHQQASDHRDQDGQSQQPIPGIHNGFHCNHSPFPIS